MHPSTCFLLPTSSSIPSFILLVCACFRFFRSLPAEGMSLTNLLLLLALSNDSSLNSFRTYHTLNAERTFYCSRSSLILLLVQLVHLQHHGMCSCIGHAEHVVPLCYQLISRFLFCIQFILNDDSMIQSFMTSFHSYENRCFQIANPSMILATQVL